MNLKCFFGIHVWSGCTCDKCGKARNHDWSADCETCANCGATRMVAHTWSSGACSACRKPINERNKDGYTRLAMAAAKGDLGIVQSLLAGDADVNAENRDNMGPLMWASQMGHLDIARALLAAGADVHAKTNINNTALILAASSGTDEIVRLLVDAGADVNASDIDGADVLCAAAGRCSADTVRLLIDQGANPPAGEEQVNFIISNAVASGDVEKLKLYIACGVDQRLTVEHLVATAVEGDVEMMRFLLDMGVDVNATEPVHGLSALLAAAAYGRLHMVKFLVKQGANLSAHDRYGNDSIALGSLKRQAETVAFLESLGRMVASGSCQPEQLPTAAGPNYSVGDRGPADGIVFFVDDSGHHGVEAHAEDCGEATWPIASCQARDLGAGWRLPTHDELLYLYRRRKAIGGFRDGFYWSSTEVTPDSTWQAVVFTNGNSMPLRKNGDACYVRAVRDF